MKTLKRAFGENIVPVVFACSDAFVPQAAVAIQSLIVHSTAAHNYDLIFLHTEISENNQRIMQAMVAELPNISLRFFNVKEYIEPEKLRVHAQYSVETFYRLLIPQLLFEYEKALYLDSDLTVLCDVADLIEIDIGENLVAAVLDIGEICRRSIDPKLKEYHDHILKLKDPNSYFQAGVMVFNIREFNKIFLPNELLEYAEQREYLYVDQDVLNAKCSGRIYTLDANWNVFSDTWGYTEYLRTVSESAYKTYMEAQKIPHIIHFGGGWKPWDNPTPPFGEVYWKYARQTPFYEITLYRMLKGGSPNFGPPYRSRARKLADKLMPKGSRRRNLAKKILPKGSRRWDFFKKIYYKIFKR